MKRVVSNWGAVIIIALLFVGSWAGQWFTQWAEFVADQESHGQEANVADYMPEFWASTFENWQSEFLQLAIQAILIASFIGGKYLFRADYNADKEDVERILKAIKERNENDPS